MTLGTILLIIVILLLIGTIPSWPHSRGGAMVRVGASGWCCWSWSSCCCWARYSRG